MLRSANMLWLLLSGLLLCLPLAAQASEQHDRDSTGSAYITYAGLPAEARATLRLIKQHGPFPYPRDGVQFGNYEHRLPPHARGYYHEYTVNTPEARNRGARRIVCGRAGECYYSGDHYRTFQLIRE